MPKKTISKEAIITKEPVIGFIVTRSKSETGNDFVWIHPLSVNFEGVLNDADSDLPENAEIVGILPGLPESYKVYGSYEIDEALKELGYEFKGAYHPDWVEKLKEESSQ